MKVFRKAAIITGVTLLAMSLTGCIRVQADMYINSDAQVEKTGLIYALDKEKMSGLGGEALTLEQFQQQMAADSPDLVDVCNFSETDIELVMECEISNGDTIDGEVINSADQLGEGLTLTKDGNTIVAKMDAAALSSGTSSFTAGASGGSGMEMDMGGSDPFSSMAGDPAAMADMLGLKMEVVLHFPGEVQSIDGPAVIDPNDPKAARIDAFKADKDITIVANAGGGSNMMVLIGGAIGLLLVLGVAAGGFLLFKKGRSGGASAGHAPSAAGAADAGQQAYQPPQQAFLQGDEFPPVQQQPVQQQPVQQQAPAAPPQFSPDGQWYWDGFQWIPANQAPPQR